MAQTIPAAPSQYFSDYSGTINASDSARIESELATFNSATNAHFAVVILPNLQEVTIEDFAEQLFQKWGIGEKGKDNGLLLIIALEERELRFEVGYGLEPFLTDAQTGGIIRNTIAPQFKEGKYAEGISRAIAAIQQILVPYAGEIASPSGTFKPKASGGLTGDQIGDIVIFIFFIGWPILTYGAAFLGRSKSFWAGGVGGLLIGVIFGAFLGFATGVFLSVLLGLVGLLLDFLLSHNYTYLKSKGLETGFRSSWGGFRGSSSSGSSFGGFRGGSSGGGGSSGRW